MAVSMTRRYQNYQPEINTYVPACNFAADFSDDTVQRVSFGTPAVAAAADILSAQSIAAAGTTQRASLLSYRSTARFGRNVKVVASGAATSTVTPRGRDYWGQPMYEVLTLNGATPVLGLKAFYLLDSVAYTLTAAVTINVGWGASFGLLYKAVKVLSEEADGAVQTVGTLTAPVLTDPMTSTTGDPRGTYVPNVTPDGAKDITGLFVFDNSVNAAGNGGLMGIQHVYA